MWGKGKKSSPGGYTDTVYRSRQTRGFESKSRCCCFYFTRSVVILILVACIVSAGGLSAVSIVFGYSQRWTYNVNRNNAQLGPYSIRTGWLYFSDNRMQPGTHVSLRQLAKAPYIFGIVAFIMSCLSVIFALFFAIRSLCGRVGRGFTCFSVLFSCNGLPIGCDLLLNASHRAINVLLIAALGGYYIVTALEVWKRENRLLNSSRVPWPDWAWALGAGSALAWFVSAGFASVLPKRHKYLDADEEFEPSRAHPVREYTPPVQGTPQGAVTPRQNSYVPSSPEPPMPEGGLNQPLASQENPSHEPQEGKKKSFVPSWSKKASAKPTAPALKGSGSEGPPSAYRSRAEEIANRYRARERPASNVELAPSAPPASKGAWG